MKFFCGKSKVADCARFVPRGWLPVNVGVDYQQLEWFVVKIEWMYHPIFTKLFEKSSWEFGHHYKGPIRVFCHVPVFEVLLESFRVHGASHPMQELMESMAAEFEF